MNFEEYRKAPGLSNSAMKDLAISPLRYWYLHLSPDRPERKESPEMKVGSALHCAVLEPNLFNDRYACEFIAPKDCLVTADNLRKFIIDSGGKPKGTTKSKLIDQVLGLNPNVPIFDVLATYHDAKCQGRIVLSEDQWGRVKGMSEALLNEPEVCAILKEGEAERSVFATDKETGTALKARMDWVRPDLIMDLKTFSQKMGKSIDRSIRDAMVNENYIRQSVFYSLLSGWPEWKGSFVFAFVESERPFETRLVKLVGRSSSAYLYWTKALAEIRGMIWLYSEYVKKYGLDKAWRDKQQIEIMSDEDFPQLAWG